MDKEGKLTTPYAIIYGMKPRIARYKVFGCPVVFKKYEPMINGKPISQFKQLQRGCRGIFIGFPANQAGWLIFVEKKISGSHLVCSTDVVFDQQFLSAIGLNKFNFSNSQSERGLAKSGQNNDDHGEETGNITNISTIVSDHWEDPKVTAIKQNLASNNQHDSSDNDKSLVNSEVPELE